VFAIQEDIATAIAGALRMPLGLKPGEKLISNRSIDPESISNIFALDRLCAHDPGVCRPRSKFWSHVARYPDYAPLWPVGGRLRFDAEL